MKSAFWSSIWTLKKEQGFSWPNLFRILLYFFKVSGSLSVKWVKDYHPAGSFNLRISDNICEALA